MKTIINHQSGLLLFVFLFLCGTYNVFAQDVDYQSDANNEIKINIGSLLLEFPEISYEHIINEESSIGISIAFPIDKEISYRFIVYPNYRLFFGKKRAAAFLLR